MASPLVLNSPEDLCNAALAQLGYKKRIGSLFDGSEASKKTLDVYGLCRQTKLKSFTWDFAERNIALTLLKTATPGGYGPTQPYNPATNPLLPWVYEYACPGDMLELRSIRDPTRLIPSFDPKPFVFRLANDTVNGTQQRVILCNLLNAIGVYTADVTDPTLWNASFQTAMVDTLSEKLVSLSGDAQWKQLLEQEDVAETQGAEMRRG